MNDSSDGGSDVVAGSIRDSHNLTREPDGSVESGAIRTFLIADIRGYTLFTQERGDEAAAKLASRFAAIARAGVEARGGEVIELRGDEALAVFGSARQAIRAAADLQARFVEETIADPSLPLTVGIGIDAGEAVPTEGGYRGGALNLAARLCGQARAGEVLASQEATHLARKVEGIRYVDRGSALLKGLSVPVRVIQLLPDQGDPALRLAPFVPTGRPPGMPSRRIPRFLLAPRNRVLLAAVLAVLAATLVPIALTRGRSHVTGQRLPKTSGTTSASVGPSTTAPKRIAAEPDSVLRIDPKTNVAIADIPVGSQPESIAFSGGYVWVVNRQDHTLSQIDPATNRVRKTLGGLSGPCNAAPDPGGGVWVTNCLAKPYVVARYTKVGDVDETIPLPDIPAGVVFGDESVWVTLLPASHRRGTVLRIDPTTGRVLHTFRVGRGAEYVDFYEGPFGEESLWVGNADDDAVSKIDAQTNTVQATIPVGYPYGVTVGGGYVWVSDRGDRSIAKIDPLGDRVVGIVEKVRGTMAVDGTTLWVADPEAPSLWRVDTGTGQVLAKYALPFSGFIAVGAGSIWISAPGRFEDQCCIK